MNERAEPRQNIVLIIAESMDGRRMGCMGDPSLTGATPNLDRLAGQGALFTRAYSTCPVCNPSRASLWSGRYPHVNDCWNNHEGLRPDVPTFRTRLEAAGYAFQKYGKLDYGYGEHSIRDRVGSWTRAAGVHRPLSRTPVPVTAHDEDADMHGADRENVRCAVQWLRDRRDSDPPFMLCLSTGLVHPAFQTHARFRARINEAAIEVPPPDPTDHPVVAYQYATKNAPRDCPPELVHEIRATYAAMVAELDDVLSPLLAELETPELRENTHVIFTSDHGEMAMEHGQILKRTLYEPSMRVPLIIRGAGVKAGLRVDRPVSWIDLYPTLMDMAGIEAPADLDGESLVAPASGRSAAARGWAFGEYHGDRCNTGAFMLVRGDWKYMRYVGFDPLLFNLRLDPWEVRNRAEEEPDRVREMDGLLATIVDAGAVDARAKAYDRRSFRAWRETAVAEGTYRMEMAQIYSGFDRLCIEDVHPWTDRDEAQIQAWLAAGREISEAADSPPRA